MSYFIKLNKEFSARKYGLGDALLLVEWVDISFSLVHNMICLAPLLKAGDQLNWNRLYYNNVITSTEHIRKKFHYQKFWQKVLKS